MKTVKQSFSILTNRTEDEILRQIEDAGRTCYKSECLIKDGSAKKFVNALISKGHESVLEHATISCRLITNRGVTHELVRHRIASYSQESSRYCNYSGDKFGSELTFIEPSRSMVELADQSYESYYKIWKDSMSQIEKDYMELVNNGVSTELARELLPNSLKTEIVVTMNIRAWRHFFALRATQFAHPQIRDLSTDMLEEFATQYPALFGDLQNK